VIKVTTRRSAVRGTADIPAPELEHFALYLKA